MYSLWRYNFVLYISIDHTEVDAIIRERSERGRKEKEMEKEKKRRGDLFSHGGRHSKRTSGYGSLEESLRKGLGTRASHYPRASFARQV